MEQKLQKILVVLTKPTSDSDKNEIKELVKTAQGEVVLFVSQERDFLDPHAVVGKGKLDEIKEYCKTQSADLVLFDCSLTSLQRRNIEKALDVDVIDRVDLILDIFALRAKTAEGKKQVELAQLSYSLANKSEKTYSRQQGGIGSRGPGETALETDKRRIKDRMHNLKCELKDLQKQRDTTRFSRKKNKMITVALVGYTNAGKSTLFNALTDENVYADDKLFATLDTTTRRMTLPCGITVLLCDTVGFIKELPTNLIEAFKSTLEEAAIADVILIVNDVSDPNCHEQLDVCNAMLDQLSVSDARLVVCNKTDKASSEQDDPVGVRISALNGIGLDNLLAEIESRVLAFYNKVRFETTVANRGKVYAYADKYSAKTVVENNENTVVFTMYLPKGFDVKIDF